MAKTFSLSAIQELDARIEEQLKHFAPMEEDEEEYEAPASKGSKAKLAVSGALAGATGVAALKTRTQDEFKNAGAIMDAKREKRHAGGIRQPGAVYRTADKAMTKTAGGLRKVAGGISKLRGRLHGLEALVDEQLREFGSGGQAALRRKMVGLAKDGDFAAARKIQKRAAVRERGKSTVLPGDPARMKKAIGGVIDGEDAWDRANKVLPPRRRFERLVGVVDEQLREFGMDPDDYVGARTQRKKRKRAIAGGVMAAGAVAGGVAAAGKGAAVKRGAMKAGHAVADKAGDALFAGSKAAKKAGMARTGKALGKGANKAWKGASKLMLQRITTVARGLVELGAR